MAVTKTLGPLHFEDLDPHRFEDLVRELIYDFKDWQSIEATGRSGSDDGFDIRAYERVANSPPDEPDDEADAEPLQARPMEGNLWMFQCKREAAIGPTKVGQIIADAVNADSPPYGYVLVAPANFSKKAFDVFRDELRKRGVMEFYLWGRAALEDMLHLPKNDRILFTFFGISLVSRRRSRSTEIRTIVTVKNKLIRTLGEEPSHESILIRDSKDTHYPYAFRHKDFDKQPRWCSHDVVDMHPLGLLAMVHKYFAYWDQERGEWDMSPAVDTARHEKHDEEKRRQHFEQRQKVEGFWEFLPHAKRAMYVKLGLIRFDQILVVDDKGDRAFKCPHIFVDFNAKTGPFTGFHEYLEINQHHHESLDGLKRINVFPAEFELPQLGTVHKDRQLKIADRAREQLKHGGRYLNTLYAVDDAFDFLEQCDVIGIDGTIDITGGNKEPILIQITNKRTLPGKTFLDRLQHDPGLQHQVREQIGRDVTAKDRVRIYEFKVTHAWQIQQYSKRDGGNS